MSLVMKKYCVNEADMQLRSFASCVLFEDHLFLDLLQQCGESTEPLFQFCDRSSKSESHKSGLVEATAWYQQSFILANKPVAKLVNIGHSW
jgi:hypothetical protein